MFKIFRITTFYPRLVRGLDIFFIILRFAMINWLSQHPFMVRFIPHRYRRNGSVLTLPERLRTVIEDLGPTFIKFGQILADRPDIISERLRSELKKLQSKAIGHDDKHAVELIEEQLGGPIETFFSEFDRKNIAAASIGQVYKGTLINGDKVVVKIQRPNIESKIKLDLQILKYFAGQLINDFPGLQAVDMVGVVDEFGNTLIQELNYMNEASNAIRFAAMLKNIHYCKVPDVYLQYSTATLLVMEDVTGLPPDDRIFLIANGYNPKVIAEEGTVILLEMIFRHGFFHADPHPGNLFILPDNKIALIEFGMVGVLKPVHLEFLASFTLGLATNNAEIITDSLLTLCGKKYFGDKDSLQFSIHDMLSRFNPISYEKINFSLLLNECVKIILQYELKLPGSIYILLKSLATIEKFGYNLDPDISLAKIVRPYAEHLIKEKYSAKGLANSLYDMMKDYGALLRDFPGEVNEILYRLKAGKLVHEVQFNDKTQITSGIKQFGNTIIMTILIAVMMAGSIAMHVHDPSSRISNVMFGISLFFSVWLLLRLIFRMGA
jgi:ubiquinone biosynthesis protein